MGRSVNALRQQHRGIVADKAKALVNKWKELLDDDEEEEEEEEEEYEPEDEEENDNHEPEATLPMDVSNIALLYEVFFAALRGTGIARIFVIVT